MLLKVPLWWVVRSNFPEGLSFGAVFYRLKLQIPSDGWCFRRLWLRGSPIQVIVITNRLNFYKLSRTSVVLSRRSFLTIDVFHPLYAMRFVSFAVELLVQDNRLWLWWSGTSNDSKLPLLSTVMWTLASRGWCVSPAPRRMLRYHPGKPNVLRFYRY